jgi:hypothetical protein
MTRSQAHSVVTNHQHGAPRVVIALYELRPEVRLRGSAKGAVLDKIFRASPGRTDLGYSPDP